MATSAAPIYRERLWPAVWIFVSTALVIPASLLVFLPINAVVGVVVAVVLYLAIVAILVFGTATIAVTDRELIAGKARLPLEVVGDLAAFSSDAARLERGQRLDARAWLLIRGWIDPVVKLALLDANDPAPYWLLSTRRPQELIDAVQQARQRIPGK